MTRSTIPLQDLAQRISEQQDDLAKLHQEYETRQAQLQELTRRKEALQTQLQEVEGEIQGVGQGSALPPKPAAAPAMPTKPATIKPGAKPSGSVTLAQLLVQIVAEAGRPLPIKELADEIVGRKHPTTSRNIPALVGDLVKKLVKKGFLRRAPNPGCDGHTIAKPRAADLCCFVLEYISGRLLCCVPTSLPPGNKPPGTSSLLLSSPA
jgi:Tfp pilus assembly protein FimV